MKIYTSNQPIVCPVCEDHPHGDPLPPSHFESEEVRCGGCGYLLLIKQSDDGKYKVS